MNISQKKVLAGFIILSYTLFLIISARALDSTSDNFEIHGAAIDSIAGTGTSSSFQNLSAGGQLAIGLSTNVKKIYSGILYWLYTLFTPQYEQIHFRWRNDDNNEASATWAANEDTQYSNLSKNTTIRLRFEISNSGWTRGTGPTFRIEYAETVTCSSGSYTAVPATPSTEHWQMSDSTNLTDGDATTNVASGLTDANATFVAGKVKDTGNQTTAITVTSENFTEIEYSIKATSFATDGGTYCFRLTNASSTTNFLYTQYAIVDLVAGNTAPTISNVELNNQSNIDLNEGTTKAISATADISDAEGCDTITNVTAKIYRSGVSGADACSTDDNNCYSVASCTEVSCGGTDATYTCNISMQFHADPTDAGTWASQYWRAWIQATDDGALTDSDYSPADAPEVNSLAAVNLNPSSIAYGSPLSPGATSNQQTVAAETTGNIAIDVKLSGTAMSSGGNSIAVGQQKYSGSSGFDWDSAGTALSGSATCHELSTSKPTASPTNQSENVYWKLRVPSPQAAGSYTGSNTFEVVNDTQCP